CVIGSVVSATEEGYSSGLSYSW
nr:immunoglobulin heavy chain junction region [Macaca mulatta]MOY21757.1 immunoglobulin heavy chain junction region [Macaca mulatta]MOY22071.1 immunoglobulin heavy chain junction region [Macaca mulatta]MOY22506.1 immunoglobulin heavy chain junction region [Macaca mulatta]MOY24432.1 immunoglobulin heavy chain junction region [Macaca mulatta]